MAKAENDGGPVIIKKYANRRLYNTKSSSYITLEDLAKMTRVGTDFQVLDAKTGDDITHSILTQIIMEEESSGEQMLPVSFLRQLIAMYGNSMQAMMPQYLEAAMENFRQNQAQFREAFDGSMAGNPFAKLAETNIAMMRAATDALMAKGKGQDEPPEPATKPESTAESDVAALRRQMEEMQKKLDELGK